MSGVSIPLSFLFLLLWASSAPVTGRMHSDGGGYISAVVTEKGLGFIKDLLLKLAIRALTPLRLPDMEKSVKIPVIGRVRLGLSNVTIDHIAVGSSAIHVGKSGVLIVASGSAANLSMDWDYSYRTWLVPIEISDRGRAFVQVEGMEVELTVSLVNQGGTLKLKVMDCGCHMEDIFITLEGGASWLYQGLIDAFEGQIKSALEVAIKKKITEGISKIDSLLQNIPKEIRVDDIISLNVTIMDDPLMGNSSVEFDMEGMFIARNEVVVPNFLRKQSRPSIFCKEPSKMLGISLNEEVFNSASVTYFDVGQLHWMVEKVPDQSLLNTAGWRFIIPQLYEKYPNDDMKLNISLTSSPIISISRQNINASIVSDVIVDVLDGSKIVSVACISMVVTASGLPEISGNNLTGRIALEDFTLNLKWSKIATFHMNLIQGVMRAFLDNVFIPHVNSHLKRGFPLPIIHGFTLKNASILSCDSRIVVCTNVMYSDSHDLVKSIPARSGVLSVYKWWRLFTAM